MPYRMRSSSTSIFIMGPLVDRIRACRAAQGLTQMRPRRRSPCVWNCCALRSAMSPKSIGSCAPTSSTETHLSRSRRKMFRSAAACGLAPRVDRLAEAGRKRHAADPVPRLGRIACGWSGRQLWACTGASPGEREDPERDGGRAEHQKHTRGADASLASHSTRLRAM
jgi:hypothetical protein